MIYEAVKTHISNIRIGDTIIEGEKLITVSGNSLKYDPFLGLTLRGNSYNLGAKPVIRAIIKHVKPLKRLAEIS